VPVRWILLSTLLALLALPVPASAKVLSRTVLIGSDGRAAEVRGTEREFESLARDPGAEPRPVRGGYLRLFFVGPGDFPANPARYYPGPRCIALDWPTYEKSCRRVHPSLERVFHRAHETQRALDLSFVTLTTKVRLACGTLPTIRQQPTVGNVSPLGTKPSAP
jgi:hypothetical protein